MGIFSKDQTDKEETRDRIDETMEEQALLIEESDGTGSKKEKKGKKHKKLRMLGRVLLVILVFVAGTFVGQFQMLMGTGLSKNTMMKKLSVLNAYIDSLYVHDYDKEDMEEGIYRGFMSGLGDKYSYYYTKEEFEQSLEEDAGEYRGIGITVYQDSDTKYVVIESTNQGGPADAAGVQAGDMVTKVDDMDVTTKSLTEVVTYIKKGAEDQVTLSVLRGSDQLSLVVKKDTIVIGSVSYEMKKDKVGYIKVDQFIETTDEDFAAAVDDLLAQGMTKLVIDLRNNGGGLVDSCQNMLSRIIEENKLLISVEYKGDKEDELLSNSKETLEIPMVILVNGNTASASEMFTGCLKDYKKATVIGTKTYGKGVLQDVIQLSDGSGLQLTVAEYVTPNGYHVNEQGIEPDIEVEQTTEELKDGWEDESKDTVLKKAFEVLEK